MACRLSYSTAGGILVPRPGMEPTCPVLEGGFYHLREVSGARLSDPGPETENLLGLVCVLQTQDRLRLCTKLGQTAWDSGSR